MSTVIDNDMAASKHESVLAVESHPVATLLCELCAGFYHLGWNVGTGGGVSIQAPGSDLIFLSPSGVHKERMKETDLFVFNSSIKEYIYSPPGKKPSASTPLFLWLHQHHGAGSVIHTHSLYSNLATIKANPWSITGQEYIKGLPLYSSGFMLQNSDVLQIPIIPNQLTEDKLLPALQEATQEFPDAPCVLVQNHGAYHFGRDIWKCKAQAECLEYLFELGYRMGKV